MQTTDIKLYTLNYSQAKTYLASLLFVVGNIILPQICHLVPQGGLIILPIYFFTLIAAYKYGWKVGVLTAILSPIANHLLFGMPAISVLPIILVKSLLLAIAAGIAANYFRRISIWILALVVISYQVIGTAIEWSMVGDLSIAIQDFKLGAAGMLIQIFGGYLFIKHAINR